MNKVASEALAREALQLIRELNLMPGQMPADHKMKLDPGQVSGEPQAFGYVTTEDVDNNGTLDTMHIVIPNVAKYLQGLNPGDLRKLKIDDRDRLVQILKPIVGLIGHEGGHIKDYRHGEENPFPGGEAAAERDEQYHLNRISTQATNNLNRNEFKRSSTMKKEIISRLVKLAGDLDGKGAYNLSDEVTGLAEKFAQEYSHSPETEKRIAEAREREAKAVLDDIRDARYGKYPQQTIGDGLINTLIFSKKYVEALKIFDSYLKKAMATGFAQKHGLTNAMELQRRIKESYSAGSAISERPTHSERPTQQAAKPKVDYAAWFAKDTGLPKEHSAEVQEALWNLGYEVDKVSGRPDGLWGQVTSASWKKFLQDYRASMIADGVPEGSVDMRMKMLTGGDISRVRFMLKMAPKSQAFAAGKDERDAARAGGALGEDPRKAFWERWLIMSPEQQEEYRAKSPRKFSRMLAYLRKQQDLKEKIMAESPLIQGLLLGRGKQLWDEYMQLSEEEKEAFKAERQEDWGHMIEYLRDRQKKVEEMKEKSPLLRGLKENPLDQSLSSPADDLQPQSADDGVDAASPIEASLEADELTKNASFNAVFWKPNVKTPFGR